MAGYKAELKAIEIKILKNLSDSSEDTILDDTDLIETLEDSKVKAKLIKEKIEEAVEIEAMINNTRNSYTAVALRGSILYFVIADLAGIDPMYQYSLKYVKNLFVDAIQHSEKNDDLEKRLETLFSVITMNIYNNICRGLFEAHKLIFSFLICTSI